MTTKEIQKIVGVTADGIIGPDTKAAIKAYQKQLGVTADGIWGTKTQAAYEKSLSKSTENGDPYGNPISTTTQTTSLNGGEEYSSLTKLLKAAQGASEGWTGTRSGITYTLKNGQLSLSNGSTYDLQGNLVTPTTTIPTTTTTPTTTSSSKTTTTLPTTTITKNTSSTTIKNLQQKLIDLGYNVGSTGADGILGSNTTAAIKKYQTDNGLTADGIAGVNTITKLNTTASTAKTAQFGNYIYNIDKNGDPYGNPISTTTQTTSLNGGEEYSSLTKLLKAAQGASEGWTGTRSGITYTLKNGQLSLSNGSTYDLQGNLVTPTTTIPTTTTTPTTTQYNLGNTNLTRGSKGEEVKQLQQALNASGIGVQLKVDGEFGPATEAAVRAYQQSKGLKVDGIVGTQTIGSLNGNQNTSLSPANQTLTDAITNDPEQQALYDALTPELKTAYDALQLQVTDSLENGKVVNPDLEITPELTAQFLEQATEKLDPYYQEIIRQNKQDLSTSFRQLQEDYNTAIKREEPAFQQSLENQDITEAESGLAFSSGRTKRESNLMTSEQQKLDDLFQTSQRSAETTATEAERKLGSREFSDLGIPSLQQYATQSRTISPSGKIASTGSRSLYTPVGNLTGNIETERQTALDTEVANLENQEIKKRILDAGDLGLTSIG